MLFGFGSVSYFIVAAMNVLWLLWWYFMCEWTDGGTPFPKKGHVVLMSILAFLPYYNLAQLLEIFIVYVLSRIFGTIKLKENKFTNFWF